MTFHPDGPLAVLSVGEDGAAEGRFVGASWFMPLRGQRVSQAAIRAVDEAWAVAGKPACTRYGVTVTRDRQWVWLDEPGVEVGQIR
ncbi:hypothetical protein [Actinomadura graeca]|uniref:hypothetical protein n=1 Tax=Actinomadura graeca TaxID=2750812 RepID=UPI001E574BBF|nr:hypothetical protein [Actinomadura graeca]